MTLPSLNAPHGYQPYPRLVFCGNVLENVKAPILVQGNAPILIGKGYVPRIWLYSPRRDRPDVWLNIVSDSKGSGAFTVEHSNGATKVYLGVIALLVVRIDGNAPTVDFLDLRPLGLEIWGNDRALHVGDSTFEGNTFASADAMISFS